MSDVNFALKNVIYSLHPDEISSQEFWNHKKQCNISFAFHHFYIGKMLALRITAFKLNYNPKHFKILFCIHLKKDFVKPICFLH